MNANIDYDIIIIGGGLVGSTLACALEPLGIKIAIVESISPQATDQPSFDDRAIALAWGSQRIFHATGLWHSIAPSATAIRRIHISEKGRFGQTHLNAEEEKVAALGYVALARNLGHTLQSAVSEREIERLCPATLVNFETHATQVKATLETPRGTKSVSARLLIAADGGRSQVRESLGIKTHEKAYDQTAIVTNVRSSKPHNNIAYERFTVDGPLALLPMTDNRFGVVLTVPTHQSDDYLALDDQSLTDELHARIGFRTGRFEQIGKRVSYPLVLMTTEQMVDQRIALVGNAAHALHPISGQGFNLGLRDIAVLADCIAAAIQEGADIGSDHVLRKYAQWRKQDVRSMALATDGLARLFSNPLGPIAFARSSGLILADLIPAIRHRIAHHAMGLRGHLPRLGRGLPYE